MMEATELQEQREALEEERQVLLVLIQKGENNLDRRNAANPDHTDLAWAYDQRQRRLALQGRELEKLSQIEAALKRMDEGTYGECQNCGESIAPARLKALPYAAYCIRCQTELER